MVLCSIENNSQGSWLAWFAAESHGAAHSAPLVHPIMCSRVALLPCCVQKKLFTLDAKQHGKGTVLFAWHPQVV